ncbi:MAG: TetR family transcriptional regulator C-terminal domain-containing protein [Flavobacteriales bacterium]|jgi:AcrR family transcriptional regulator|nr:TetR family transcriptional regulator C-terminal domain-containing protein [Flavobacteriales bacterium]
MDQRVKVTKLMLKNALLSLMEEKQLTFISITELCKKASVNRNTFYSHYDAIVDLYKEIEEQLIKEIHSTLKKPYTRKERLYEVCKTIQIHFRFFKLAFSQEHQNQTINKLLQTARNVFYYRAINQTPQYLYKESGTMAIIKNWVQNNCQETPEHIALLLYKLNHPITSKNAQQYS